jgi:hypothetical protein
VSQSAAAVVECRECRERRKEQGEAEVLWRIKSIVLRAVAGFSNFDLCSKASVVLCLCFARGDAISGMAKDFSLKLCSGEQVNCWWKRLGSLRPSVGWIVHREMPTHSEASRLRMSVPIRLARPVIPAE